MALQRSTVGRLTLGVTTYPLTNVSVEYASSVRAIRHSGLTQPTNQMVDGGEVVVCRFTMPLNIALSTWGLSVNSVSAFTLTLGKVDDALISAGADNPTFTLAGSAALYVDSFSVSEGSEATAEVVAHCVSADGDADPINGGVGSFPALSAVPDIHGLGPVVLNTTAVPGVTGFSYASGINMQSVRTDGKAFAQGVVQSGSDPVITVEHADPRAVEAIVGARGVSISGTTTLIAYGSNDDVLGATDQITITVAAGYVTPVPFSGAHGDIATGSFTIRGTSSDGSTHPFALSGV